MKNIAFLFYILLVYLTFNNLCAAEEQKHKVWYKVQVSSPANPIYVDYSTIDKNGHAVRFEQLEFFREKQRIEDKDYQYVISKREMHCGDRKFKVIEEKFFDSKLNSETNELKEDMVYRLKYSEEEIKWHQVVPNTSGEQVLKFVCVFKKENQ